MSARQFATLWGENGDLVNVIALIDEIAEKLELATAGGKGPVPGWPSRPTPGHLDGRYP